MSEKEIKNIYTLDGKVPLFKALPFGLQTILITLVSNVVPIIVIANICGLSASQQATLVQSAMLIAGIGTLIQLFPIGVIGSRLPVVMGISFTFVSVFSYVGIRFGYGAIVGATIVGGIVEGVLGLLAKYWMKYITPIVSANVVFAIGMSLLPVVANSFGGGNGSTDFGSWQNWIAGSVTFLVSLLFYIFGKGYFRNLSIIFSLAVGYVVAMAFGMVDFSVIGSASLVALPKLLPIKPEFHLNAILAVIIIYMVSATETIGDTQAIADAGLHRSTSPREIRGALACDGFISSVSGIFGCTPITSYSENIGIIAMTGVINRYTLGAGAFVLVLSGFVPIIGAVLSSIPMSVLGGSIIMAIGNIVVSGIKMISDCGNTKRNATITAISLGVGMGFTQVPQIFEKFPDMFKMVFAENFVAVVFVIAILLDRILPKDK